LGNEYTVTDFLEGREIRSLGQHTGTSAQVRPTAFIDWPPWRC
jgi:hypothetical protein